jgi:hypothetical protein
MCHIKLYTTGLSKEERGDTGVELIASIEDAVRQSVAEHGDSAVAVIPEGPYVIPVFAAQGASAD